MDESPTQNRTPPTPSGRATVGMCLALAVITLAVFGQVHRHEFINYDDQVYVTENPHVLKGVTWEGVRAAFSTGQAGNWHPLTWLSHMLDVQWFGLNAGAHHLTSVLLHTINALLLFLLLRSTTGSFWRAGLVAALFALHPLHVESVAWVAERKDVLSAFFGLLTLLAYAGYVRKAEDGRQRTEDGKASTRRGAAVCYGAALLGFALGLMSKPMLVTWPVVLLLLDWWPLKRVPSRRLVLEKLPFLLPALATCVVTISVQSEAGAMAAQRGFPERVANAFISCARYLIKTVWPTDLAVFYPFPPAWPMVNVLAAAVLVIGISVIALRLARRTPYLMVGWFWFLITLGPVIGLIQVGWQSMADRYTYLPLIGIFIVIAWGAAAMTVRLPKTRGLVAALATSVLVLLSARTWNQIANWRNSETLFAHALAVTQDNEVAENNLGTALQVQGKEDEAGAHFQAALRIKPRYPEALMNLGIHLARKGQTEEGLRQLTMALELSPTATTRYNLGTTLLQCGRPADALDHLRQAAALLPGLPEAHLNLGLAEAGVGNPAAAIAAYEAALRLKPEWFAAHFNLGNAWAAQRQFEQAATEFATAIRLQADDVTAHFNLANALLELGKSDEAMGQLAQVLQLTPADREARQLLVTVAARGGNAEAAYTNLLELVRAQPDANTQFQLAQVLVVLRRSTEALTHYREALRLKPDWAEACNDLAWLLATHPEAAQRKGGEAVTLAERATALKRVPLFLGTLAAAYAEAGRFAEAIRTAEEAQRLAAAAGDATLAERNKTLADLYRSGKAYHEPQ